MEILLVALAVQALNTVLFFRSRRALLYSNLPFASNSRSTRESSGGRGLKNRDRLFWVLLSRLWLNWRSFLVLVKPDTVIRWQKKRFSSGTSGDESRGRAGPP